MECSHVVAQELCVETARNLRHVALFNSEPNWIGQISLHRQQDVPPVQDESALRCRFVRPGGKKSAGPMVPATRFVGKAIRSEERRVGKECVVRVDLGGRRILKKKKKKK